MPSTENVYRLAVELRIRSAINRARLEGTQLEHAGLKGRLREIVISDLLAPLLPARYSIGTGCMVDAEGRQSPQTDIIIYDTHLLAPILYSPTEGVYPIDTCTHFIEVKSTLNATELRKSVEKTQNKFSSLRYSEGFFDSAHSPIPRTLRPVKRIPVVRTLVAFGSDLSTSQGRHAELYRYAEYDKDALTDPAYQVICIVGRGYWFFDYGISSWRFSKPHKTKYTEVIGLLTGIGNWIRDVSNSRGFPLPSAYLCDPSVSIRSKISSPTQRKLEQNLGKKFSKKRRATKSARKK